MASLNKIMLIGNAGRDAEMRYTGQGTPVTSFTLAVNRRFTAQGERQEETEWFEIVCWNKLAETANQYVQKGKQVYVEGRIRARRWQGQDGQQRTSLEVTANELVLLGSAGGAGGSLPPGDFSGSGGGGDLSPDDLPF
jgi:single-strand DNA-binding protein